VKRGYLLGPGPLWDKLLAGKELSAEEVKMLSVGVASPFREEVEFWAVVYSAHERSVPPEPKRAVGTIVLLINLMWEFRAIYGACAECIDAIVHHFASAALIALGKAHGLRPIVHEGFYRGYGYIVMALSEQGLQEGIRAMEEGIEEEMCKKGEWCL